MKESHDINIFIENKLVIIEDLKMKESHDIKIVIENKPDLD